MVPLGPACQFVPQGITSESEPTQVRLDDIGKSNSTSLKCQYPFNPPDILRRSLGRRTVLTCKACVRLTLSALGLMSSILLDIVYYRV
jgi:hypothetical protein